MRIPNFFLALLVTTSLLHAAPEIGKPAPDFTLKDGTGKEHSLSDYAGKTVVLEWFNEGCPFVKKHYGSRNMQDLQKAATDSGVVWLTIISSAPGKQGHYTPEQAVAKYEELGMASTALLLDESGEVGRAYNARTTPEMFVIDSKGTLVYMGAIDDKPTPDPASLDGAKTYVQAALTELAAGEPVSTPQTKSYGCGVKY